MNNQSPNYEFQYDLGGHDFYKVNTHVAPDVQPSGGFWDGVGDAFSNLVNIYSQVQQVRATDFSAQQNQQNSMTNQPQRPQNTNAQPAVIGGESDKAGHTSQNWLLLAAVGAAVFFL
jgi:hypothetical protein